MHPKSHEAVAGVVLRIPSNNLVLIEVQQDIAIGEVINAHSRQELFEMVVSRMEDEEGRIRYQARNGDRVVMKFPFQLQPGDWLEKTLHCSGCLKVEAIIEPADICFLNGVMEGYNDLAVLRTLDSSRGLVELIGPSCYQEEIDKVLFCLRKEMPCLEIKAVIKGSASMEL